MNIKQFFKEHIKLSHKKHIENHKNMRKFRKFQIETKLEHDRLVQQQRALSRELRFYRRQRNSAKEQELHQKLEETQEKLSEIHLKMQVGNRNSEDLNHYYSRIRYSRIFVLIFNLLLWFLLFRFGGVQIGLKIVILFFALASSLGSLFEMLFLLRIRERILKPIDKLKDGVDEISKGNYLVQVKTDTNNEVGNLIEAFNKMAQKLYEAEALKAEYENNRKTLIANISHDLKTPITSVQGYIEAIAEQDDLSEEKLKKYLKIIYNNTAYINKLIDDLFLFSKLDMQKLDFHFEEVSIRPFFFDLMEEQRLDFEEKNITFTFSDELSCERIVKLDAKRFCQIMHNLLDNAVKYGQQTELTIDAKLYESGDNICVDLRDNGEGIEEEQLEQIFNRFYRVDKERTKDFSSTGLGLAIAKELAQAHGGDITVQSSKGTGTCFTVSIPYIIPFSNKECF
jgi:signal transduction histidine kinase